MTTPPDGPSPPPDNNPDLPTHVYAPGSEPPRYLHVPLVSSDQDPEEVLLRYRLLTERPMQGGIGEVWKVHDQHLNRVVALKKLRPDRAHDSVAQTSFLHEAEVTAQLHHPNIVPVYDLFVPVARDKAFYTMPFLEGRSLAEAVRAYHAGRATAGAPALRELATAFVAVCRAVAYANEHGVIHRDLKGQNIMLGGPGEIFVVDWGLAKVVGRGDDPYGLPVLRSAADDDLRTRLGTRKGTPGFMAPEQAAGRVDLIDRRSDVYGLGAVLYEILTGKPPVELSPEETRKLLGAETLPTKLSPLEFLKLSEELLRKVEHEPVVPPSRIWSAAPRAVEAICLKALAKKREERYPSAAALAEDVARWLVDEPVAVYRDPLPVRFARLVRKHRTLAGTAALVLLIVVVGLAAGLWAVDAERAETVRERDQKELARQQAEQAAAAERQAKVAAEAAGKLARDRLGYVENVNRILTSVFRDLNPRLEDQGGPPLLAQLAEQLDQAAALLEGEAVGDPLKVARLQLDLGVSLLTLGFPTRAAELTGKATRTLEARLGPDHDDTLRGLTGLALAHQAAGLADQAVSLFEATLQKRKAKLGPDHADTLTNMNNLASAYQAAGKLDLALPLFEQTLARRTARLGANDPLTLTSMNNLALAYQAAGRLDLALPLFEQAMAKYKVRVGLDHPDTLQCMNNLAGAYVTAGEPDRAVPLYDEALAKRKAKLGPNHPQTLQGMNNLAMAYQAAGKLGLALPLLVETLAKRKARLGADHPDTLTSMSNLALAYQAAGKLDLAQPLFADVLKKHKAGLGADHPDTLLSMNNLAEAYRVAGKLNLALPLFEQTLAKQKVNPGPDHPHTLHTMNNLALAYLAAGKGDAALHLFEETLRLRQTRLGADHPDTLTSMNNLANAYLTAGQFDRAVALFDETLQKRKVRLSADHPDTLTSINNLAMAYVYAGKLDRAVPLCEQALEKRKARLGPDHPDTLLSMYNLARVYVESHRHADAEPLLAAWLDRQRSKLPADDVGLAGHLSLLGECRVLLKMYSAAEPPLRDSLAIYLKKDPNSIGRHWSASLLGAALAGQQKYVEAEPLLLDSARPFVANAAKLSPANRQLMLAAVQRVIELYDAWDRPADAARWRKQLKALTAAGKQVVP
jgi:serine/threonine protein kinase